MFGQRKHPSLPNRVSNRPAYGADIRRLRESFTRSVAQRQLEHAFRLAAQLEALEPAEPRWPHKRGDLLRNFGKPAEAAQAYRRAARLYDDQNLGARGKAMRTLARTLAGATVPMATDAELHAMVIG